MGMNSGSPSLTTVEPLLQTDNDGASCGSTSHNHERQFVESTVGFNLACADDSLEITVVNSGSTIAGELLITKNGTELTWNVNGYLYDRRHQRAGPLQCIEADPTALFK